MVVGVPALRVRYRKPTHHLGQFTVFARPNQHVPVIGHHAVAEKSHFRPLECLLQHALERRVILLLLEQTHPPHCAVEHVVDDSAGSFSQTSWHVLRLAEPHVVVKEKTPDPFIPPGDLDASQIQREQLILLRRVRRIG